MEITNLRCEYTENPLFISKKPRLSWQIEGEGRNVIQQAYRIIVVIGNTIAWDSGKVESSQSSNVYYEGEIKSDTRYNWQVSVWIDGEIYESQEVFFETGLIGQKDWRAEWLYEGDSWVKGWAPLFRKTFHAHTLIKRAKAYICGLGYYTQKCRDIKAAFNQYFYNKDIGSYGYQTSNAMALELGLVEEENRKKVSEALVDDIVSKNNMHFTVGIIGMKYIFDALCNNGYAGVAEALIETTTYPGFGANIHKGATTLWEVWKDTPNNPSSHNHPMFGSVSAWFYKYIAGVKIDEEQPGFKKIHINPVIFPYIKSCICSVGTTYGEIRCNYKYIGNTFKMDINIPHNTSAKIGLLGGKAVVNGKKVEKSSIDVGSGKYNIIISRER